MVGDRRWRTCEGDRRDCRHSSVGVRGCGQVARLRRRVIERDGVGLVGRAGVGSYNGAAVRGPGYGF